ncbi:MAG: hypothetical protein AMJ84_13325 [Acidithiobacillales bacterium SM23_46]|nr:MAG: hypothetical protein AMJ84_13325 [Acidithiobacillales bacterium SM23_46]
MHKAICDIRSGVRGLALECLCRLPPQGIRVFEGQRQAWSRGTLLSDLARDFGVPRLAVRHALQNLPKYYGVTFGMIQAAQCRGACIRAAGHGAFISPRGWGTDDDPGPGQQAAENYATGHPDLTVEEGAAVAAAWQLATRHPG